MTLFQCVFQKFKDNKNLRWLLGFFIIVISAALMEKVVRVGSFPTWRDRNYELAAVDSIRACAIFQKTYKDTYGTYDVNKDDLRNCVQNTPEEYAFYFTKEEMPGNFVSTLSTQDLPYLAPESFRLLLSVRHKYRPEIFFWVVDQEGSPRILDQRVEIQN